MKHQFLALLLWSTLAFLFVGVAYIGYLDYTVTRQFEGKRWAVPARVYAAPEQLFVGDGRNAGSVVRLLKTLRYRYDRNLSARATYYRKGNTVFIKTRGFEFWEKTETSLTLRITFAGQRLARIIDLGSSKSVPIVRLEPLQIGSFYPTRKEDRILVKLADVPETLIQALLATEDRRFYEHIGVSIRGIFRALLANLRAGSIVQGGSTITQQLVKNFYLSPERTLWRKLNEALMSLILDARYEKNEILEAYLNEIYLGQDGSRAIHGFGLASEFYFGRSLKDLGLEENALLVGLVKGPSYYDPWRHPQRAEKRRNDVIDVMDQVGKISSAQAENAKNRALNLAKKRHAVAGRYPAYMELVRHQLRREYKEQDLTSEGLRIFTTLKTETQSALENTVSESISGLEKKAGVSKLQVAAILTRREGGEVVAMIGGRNADFAGFNRAIKAWRPVGSLIKPLIYLTALEDSDRYTLTTLLDDTEIRVPAKSGTTWIPKNYDRKEHGRVPLHEALANSYNLATVRLGLDVGLARTAKTLRNFGINRDFRLYPSFLLGAVELSPLDVTQIFQVLASEGFNTPLKTIRAVFSKEGGRLQRYPLTVRQVADPDAAFLIVTILQEAVRQGTGKSVYSILPKHMNVVGKTGTTNDFRDSWFAGFTGDYLGTVWLGRDDNKPIHLSGAGGALKVWARVMKKISNNPVDLYLPENIEMVWINTKDGLRGSEQCPNAVQYPFIRGSAPEDYSSCAESPIEKAGSWFRKFFENE